MTLEEVSQKSKVSKSLLSQIKRNISVPMVITLERITKAYGIVISRLFLELENSVQRSAPLTSKKKRL